MARGAGDLLLAGMPWKVEELMVIKTRYRDIQLEEMRSSHIGHAVSFPPDLWEELRGKPLTIKTDPVFVDYGCGGPWYEVVGDEKQVGVCPHTAEIGD